MELGLRTHFDFLLPKGYVDAEGRLHRRGEMRLATARDEIEPLRDPRVTQNEAYLTVLVLSRVITRLGDTTSVTPEVVEGLFAADLAYLQDFYGIANFGDQSQLVGDLGADDDASQTALADDTNYDAVIGVEATTEAAPPASPLPIDRRPSVEEVPPAMEA